MNYRVFYIFLCILYLLGPTIGMSQEGQIIDAEYGPPETANEWQKFSIPLTADAFGVSDTEFNQVLSNVQRFQIRTEMHTGNDVGGLDQINIADRYVSTFDSGNEEWNAAGDGTMEWIASGGISSGYLQISDWASGDWHYAVAPPSWTGDWSDMIGDSIEFYYKTDQPSYAGVVEISSVLDKRLILTASSLTLVPGGTGTLTIKLSQPTTGGASVQLQSSSPGCVEIPSAVSIPANQTTAQVTMRVPEDAEPGCSSVLTASATDFGSSRVTVNVESEYQPAVLAGRVTDATTGVGIALAQVSVAGLSTTTDGDGYYRIENIPTNLVTANFVGEPRSGDAPLTVQFTDLSGTSYQTLSASSDGYFPYETAISIEPGETATIDISLSPVITDKEFRIVLNWGEQPADLDVHLLVPGDESNVSDHVYYGSRGEFNMYPWALLDIDRRQGFGPETITIQKLLAGKYIIFVHNYSGDADIKTSSGVVQIYGKAGLLHTVNVPMSGDGRYWSIGEINGSTGQVTVTNRLLTEQPRFPSSTQGLGKLATKNTIEMDNIVNGITTWQWDFDNDGVIDATTQNPEYTYTAAGQYTVTLTVSDGVDEYIERKENYITVSSDTPVLSGYDVSVSSIDVSNFPVVKCFVSVTDATLKRPAQNLISVNFSATEDEADVSSLTVRRMDATSGARADIVFVFDTTGSMDDEIATLKSKAIAFADSLQASGVDYRLGLVTFADEVLQVHDFTNDAAEFKTWIEGLVAQGGGDTKENALEGLASAFRLSYREMTQKIAILITDADYHEAGESGNGTTAYTTDSMISELQEQQMMVNVVGPDLSQYERISDDSGGQYYNIFGDFADIITRLGAQITSQYVVTFVAPQPVADNSWRDIDITVVNGDKGGLGEGRYFIGSSRVLMNPPTVLGRKDATFVVDIRVENIVNLSMAHFFITFDNSKLEALNIFEGDFLAQGEANTAFVREIKNSSGYVDITASRLASGVEPGVSGSGLLAQVTFRVLTDECTSQINFQSPEFRDPAGAPISVTTNGVQLHAFGTSGDSFVLCDFDEDLDIDTRDFALLGTYWQPANATEGDVGPADGAAPMMTPTPDGVVNYKDLFVFTQMWNWYHAAITTEPAGLQKSEGAALSWQPVDMQSDTKKRIAILVDDIESLAMGHLRIQYDARNLEFLSASEGALLAPDESSVALLAQESGGGLVDISFSRLTAVGQSAHVKGSGVLLHLDFQTHDNNVSPAIFIDSFDFRTARNTPVYVKTSVNDFDISPTQRPESYALNNYPNPFNSRTTIEFALPQSGEVKLEVINILGQPIRTLVHQHMEAGDHKMAWDGKNENGIEVVSGTYLIRLQSQHEQLVRKILYMK